MRQFTSTDVAWLHPLWLGVLVAVSALLTAGYTCVTPFAAFAVITAATLSRRQALSCVMAAWLANQAAGFGLLSYPWTTDTVAWGIAIGGAAVIATVAAQSVRGRLGSRAEPVRLGVAFVAAFVVDQLTLYAAAVSVLGGTAAFVPQIVGQVALVNALTLGVLIGLHQLLALVTLATRRRRAHASAARYA